MELSVQQLIKEGIHNENNSYTNNITLSYLTNPSYQTGLAKKRPEILQNNKEEIKFYRKRITALMKDMLKGEVPSEGLKKIHDGYVLSIIDHFKMIDTSDMIQEEYGNNLINEVSSIVYKDSSLDEANKEIMNKPKISSTLDNFITSKTITMKEIIPPPKKRQLNLNKIELKTKGLKKKEKESK